MLINFRVENYLSIDKMSTFSMTLGKTRKHKKNIIDSKSIDVLKFATIYGTNASGKSNFVRAMDFSKKLITEEVKLNQNINEYNRNNKENKNRKSRFEFEISINDKIYSYGFSIILNEKSLAEEWLYDVTDEEQAIFTRSNDQIDINYQYLNLLEQDKNRLKVYADDIKNNEIVLFLSSLNVNKNRIKIDDKDIVLHTIYDWFNRTLEVISPDGTTRDFGLTYQNEEYLDQLSKFLRDNDTGIDKVALEKSEGRMTDIPVEIEKEIRGQVQSDFKEKDAKGAFLRGPKSIYTFLKKDEDVEMYEIVFYHGTENVKYKFGEESDGTIRLIELFSIISNKKEKVFVVDELDRSLHPLLTYNFVENFLGKKVDDQLIVTTHEDRLLDLNLLRRDEIWFVEKNPQGNSKIYSLEQYKERFDKNINNAYLDGRYGAIPKLNNLVANFNLELEE